MISYYPLQETLNEKGISIGELEDMLGYYTLREKLNEHVYLSLKTIDNICNALGVGLNKVISYVPNKQQPIVELNKPVFVKPDWDKIKKINGIRGFRLMSVEMGYKPMYIAMLKRREFIGIDILQRIKENLDDYKDCKHDLSSLYLEKREGRAPRKSKDSINESQL